MLQDSSMLVPAQSCLHSLLGAQVSFPVMRFCLTAVAVRVDRNALVPRLSQTSKAKATYTNMDPSSPDPLQDPSLNPRATIYRSILVHHTTLQVVHGDLTDECTDAITNAANTSLWLGGGVAGAVDRKGGPKVNRECTEYVRNHGELKVGEVAVTGAGKMPAKHVIHAVGPIYAKRSRENHVLLTKAVLNTFRAAEQRSLCSVSIPGLSSGIYGYPKDQCANVMLAAFAQYLTVCPSTCLRLVRFINLDLPTVICFRQELDRVRRELQAMGLRLAEESPALQGSAPIESRPKRPKSDPEVAGNASETRSNQCSGATKTGSPSSKI